MRKLTVKNFSVIEDAELEFGKITVLIGPQASGKSLMCKLAYFLGREVIEVAIERLVNRSEYSEFIAAVHRDFSKSFPPGGWGGASWSITFEAEEYSVTVSPLSTANGLSNVSVLFAESFRQAYSTRLNETVIEQQRTGFLPPVEGLRSLAATRLFQLAGRGVWDSSTYIPLERSYFVDAKKGYRILGGEADRLSARFANILADSMNLDAPKHRVSKYLNGRIQLLLGQDDWSLVFLDGRFLPLSHLSSGSKELLPILSVLDFYENRRQAMGNQLISEELYGNRLYFFDDFTIEEPEASVFPQTQYELIQELAALANEVHFNPHFTITTHSPYILSAFNDLIEAGRLGVDKELRAEVSNIVEEKYWITPGDFKAYSIHDGKLESIMDPETGLINGEYLDAISNKIGGDFDALLRIGYAKS